ncbi:MAG: trpF [Acidimicrobiia bacterium]|nr:trpF [Acidimicrobiia bacterium]
MFVKICGITNEDDALLAVALGADALGFIFAPSTRRVNVQAVHDITRRLPPEVITVGVFRDELPDRVVEMAFAAGVRAVQLHGHETPEVTQRVKAKIPFVIQAFAAGSSGLERAREHGADVILIDAAQPGSGRVFDWTLVDQAPVGLRMMLAGGLTPQNVATAIAQVEPWGVDVSSGIERTPGRKDPVKMQAFIEAARASAPERAEAGVPRFYDWANEL